MSLELASRGITVNAVAPGIIATGMTIGFDAKLIADLMPMKRAGTPDEVANLVAFLASDAASSITGQIIAVGAGSAECARRQSQCKVGPSRHVPRALCD